MSMLFRSILNQNTFSSKNEILEIFIIWYIDRFYITIDIIYIIIIHIDIDINSIDINIIGINIVIHNIDDNIDFIINIVIDTWVSFLTP